MVKYFAYGSNMSFARIKERIKSVEPGVIGKLEDYSFTCNKIGGVRSAKANIEPKKGETVWGIIYELTEEEIKELDMYEGGYKRIKVTLETSNGLTNAYTYISQQTSDNINADSWYKDYIIEGAEEYDLPAQYIGKLADSIEV